MYSRLLRALTVGLAVFLTFSSIAKAQVETEATEAQSFNVITGFYKLPAAIDATVSTELATELWAQVWRPDTGGPYPLIIFLHGNHSTCGRFDAAQGIRIDDRSDYTFSGTCPSGYVVAPSHLGYNYVTQTLAGHGYIVVSINANRGVNAAPGVSGDAGLNLRRGRLVLRHMQELSKWNAGTATPPASLGFSLSGLLDFSHVGLMGHSRGGEGMRAAIAQYRDAGSPWPGRIGAVNFEGLFEIGPVDGQTSRVLNALELDWNVLLPACDGDVADLQGVKPLDRMLKIGNESTNFKKSSLQVFGANHNFYNTQWQQSDSSGCRGQAALFPQTGGSASQQTTGSEPLLRFFRAHIGTAVTPGLAKMFDPSVPLPGKMTAVTQYARGFTPTPRAAANFIVDDFDNATGTSSRGVPNESSGLSEYVHGATGSSHDSSQRAAAVSWNTPSFLQVNASATGANVSAFKTLEFRVALRCFGILCSRPPNATGDVDFDISLVHSDGGVAFLPAPLKSYAVVRRPTGSSFILNTVLQTVRIPLADFATADLTRFKGIRFTFDRTAAASIFLGNVRLDKAPAGPGGLAPVMMSAATPVSDAAVQSSFPWETNRIVEVRPSRVTTDSGSVRSAVEIELYSSRPFPVGNALPILSIDGRTYDLSRFVGQDRHRIIFTLEDVDLAKLPSGNAVLLTIGGAAPWDFGKLP